MTATNLKAASASVAINGPAMRELRIARGIEIKELAAELGILDSSVSKIELGHQRNVTARLYRRILQALAIRDQRVLRADLAESWAA